MNQGVALGEPSVWYVFTPTETRFIQANTNDSDYFAGIDVYTGAPGSLSHFTCGDSISRVCRHRWHDVLLQGPGRRKPDVLSP